LEEAARRAGIYDEPDLKRFSAEYQEDIVLATMREFTISRKIILSEAEVRQYYDEHLEFFFHKGSTWIEELLLPTEAAAQELKKQLEAGVRFEEFASLSLRSGAVKSKAQFHFHPLEKVRYPRLLPAILAAPPGQLVGPLELQSGFSVFRLLKQEEGAVESFASAGRRAKGLLRRQREKVMFRDMITALREQYADQTEIFAAQLHAALPDSLVGVE
jgi:parvulin-like peptidyl-prolyl isomerase